VTLELLMTMVALATLAKVSPVQLVMKVNLVIMELLVLLALLGLLALKEKSADLEKIELAVREILASLDHKALMDLLDMEFQEIRVR